MEEVPAQKAGHSIRLAVLSEHSKIEELKAKMEASLPDTPHDTPPPLQSDSPSSAEAVEPIAAENLPPMKKLVEGKVIAALRTVYDPEIPVNIYELGLIYGIEVDDTNYVKVKMTLTSPACPVAGSLPGEVEKKVESIEEVRGAEVELTWDPPWSKDRMSEVAMLQLGMF